MTELSNYREFEGRHYETGTIRNYWAYQGVKAPHTGKPYSEALLMGISGGAVMGYFSFAYKGYDPMVRILIRNTFDPLSTLLERLGVVQNVRQTTNPDKAVKNLTDVLEEGCPAIVWADMWSMPYNHLEYDSGMWGMFPLVVYGHNDKTGAVCVADRAAVGLMVTPSEFAAARGRVKKDKFRLMTIDPPNEAKLDSAVQKGIWDCIKLYTEKPPKGARDNFGFAAYQHWADLLIKPKMRLSWDIEFPTGPKFYAGLTTAFESVMLWGVNEGAERDLYADFLDEAAVILSRDDLKKAAKHFRDSGQAWRDLGHALLPESVAPFGEAGKLMLHRHHAFIEKGNDAGDEIVRANQRLKEIRKSMDTDFPLDGEGVKAHKETLREHVLKIHDIERDAIAAMQGAMAGD